MQPQAAASKEDKPTVSLAAFYNLAMASRGFKLAPHHLPICMGLEDRRILSLMVISGPGNGKSTLTSQVYPAWRLGYDRNTTILAVSAGESLMQQAQSAVAETITVNPQYARVFPGVEPDKGRGWSDEKGLFVVRDTVGDPDASFLAIGLSSKRLTGVHAREIIMDDLHNKDNSYTAEACTKVTQTFYDTLLGRADARGARYVLSGRRWNTTDVYGSLKGNGDWVTMELPAERQGQERLWWDVYVPSNLKCVFSEKYEPERYQRYPDLVHYRIFYGIDPAHTGFYWPGNAAKRREYFSVKRNQPLVAEATYQCNPDARENAIFVDGDFCEETFLSPEALREGVASLEVQEFLSTNNGRIVQSWDTAAGKSADAAYSVCVTAALVPSNNWWRGEDPRIVGDAERHNRVYILDVYRDKVDFTQLARKVRYLHKRWNSSLVLIEEKSSGKQLLQVYRTMGVPIKAVQALDSKVSRAVDAVSGNEGTAQGWFRQHRVVMPTGAKWLPTFIDEFKDFNGAKASSRKDQVDATVHLLNYAIGSGMGKLVLPDESIQHEISMGVTKDGGLSQYLSGMFTPAGLSRSEYFASGLPYKGIRPFLQTQDTYDPADVLCQKCAFYRRATGMCKLHKHKVQAIATCQMFEKRLISERQDAIVDAAEKM